MKGQMALAMAANVCEMIAARSTMEEIETLVNSNQFSDVPKAFKDAILRQCAEKMKNRFEDGE